MRSSTKTAPITAAPGQVWRGQPEASREGALPSYMRAYYTIKPLIPRRTQVQMRRTYAKWQRLKSTHSWPLNPASTTKPPGWCGWPDGKRFAVVLTHDVEGQRGLKRVEQTMEIEQHRGFRSSFNFVPERSRPSPQLRGLLSSQGFEVGVHGLCHDGLLLNSYDIFFQRSVKINGYLEEWGAVGFRAPSMHGNLQWFHDLNIKYDLSTFDTDPFEPISVGTHTLFPFWVPNEQKGDGYVELPYTLVQDYTLFVVLQERSIDIWKRQIDWIAQHGGMVLVNTHPDYMVFDGSPNAIDEYPSEHYDAMLSYLQSQYAGEFIHMLPRETGSYCEEQWTIDQ